MESVPVNPGDGVRDWNLLESAVNRPRQPADGEPLAQRLRDSVGGRIGEESADEGRGTTVTFWLSTVGRAGTAIDAGDGRSTRIW